MTNTDVPVSGAILKPALSVIVAVDTAPSLVATLETYRSALDALEIPYEFFCSVDGRGEALVAELIALAETWPELTVLGQRPWIDDDAALQAAVKRSKGERVLSLAAWPEISTDGIAGLVDALEDSEMAVAVRQGLEPSWRNRVLQRTLRVLFGRSVPDLFCRARASRRSVLEEVSSFGVRQHFIPTIAAELGHSVAEVDVDQVTESPAVATKFVFKPLGHVWALFDAMMLYVVLKFLRRPLRFFGAVGLPILLVGASITAVYLAMRIFGDWSLADRPGLIFAVLMVVLGVQIIALGLVGEIIIFANSRRMKQYTVKSVLRQDPKD